MENGPLCLECAFHLFERDRRSVEHETIDTRTAGRLRYPRLRDTNAAVGKCHPPVNDTSFRVRKNVEADIDGAGGCLKPRVAVVGRRERLSPLRQIARLSKKVEHFTARRPD